MKKILLALLFFVFVAGGLLLVSLPVTNKVPPLTAKETELFSKMWEALYFNSYFSYTLLGSKPVSIETWSKNPLGLHPPSSFFLFEGETKELWERFSQAHPSDHYALIFTEYTLPSTINPEPQHYGEIVFINKAEMKRCFEEHQKLFMKSLSLPDFSPETIVTQTLKSGNHELIGIILGFGAYNSKYFQRGYDLTAYYKYECYFPNQTCLKEKDLEILKRSVSGSLLNPIDLPPQEVALELEKRRLHVFEILSNHDNPLSPLSLPCFRAEKDHPETIALLETYQKEQKKAVQFGFSKPLLDSILNLYFFGVSHE